MNKNNMLNGEDVLAVGIDLQEKLVPAVFDKEGLEDRCNRLIEGLNTLGVRTIVSQQYTKGLGQTIPSIRKTLGNDEYFEKRTFSAMGSEEFRKAVADSGKKTILIFGIESHICMMQTALDMINEGYKVYAVEDASASRTERNHRMAMERLAGEGAVVTTYEAALFEILETSTSPDFKTISKIVK